MTWQYFRIAARGGGSAYVRADLHALTAEHFDANSHAWVRDDRLADEIAYNGLGEEITPAEVDKVIADASFTPRQADC